MKLLHVGRRLQTVLRVMVLLVVLLILLLLLVGHVFILRIAHELWIMCLCLLLVPAPFLFQFLIDEAHAPSCRLTYLIKNSKNFFLLTSTGQTVSRDGKGSKCNTCDTTELELATSFCADVRPCLPVLEMCTNAADQPRVVHQQIMHFGLVGTLKRVCLGQKTHDCMIEEPCRNCGPFD